MTSEAFDIIRFTIVIIVMISASISDWRIREVSDRHWLVLGMFGVACMMYSAIDRGIEIEHGMMIAGTVMAVLSILYDVEIGKKVTVVYYTVLALLFIIPVMTAWDDSLIREFTMVPIAFIVFLGTFFMGVIKGGADAKCLIVLAAVFQTYPQFFNFPVMGIPSTDVTLIVQFAFAVFFHAALFSLSVAFFNIAKNLKNGEISIRMFSGYRIPIDAPPSHVWPTEAVIDGNIVSTGRIQNVSVMEDLKAAGAKDVRVTPMIPFLLPLTAAVLFVTFFGNLLFIPFI